MVKVLITGGSGFIGRNLIEGLSDDYLVLAPNSRELDLLDSQAVLEFFVKEQPSLVIHCATHDASRSSDKDKKIVLENNLRMFFNLVRAKNSDVRMFYFGSGAEYSKDHYIPKMKEEYFGKNVPDNQYGFSKYIMAQYIKGFDNIYDLRIFGCFGKYEDYRIRFISNAICRALFDEDIEMQQNVFFDYLYVEDLVKIMRWFLAQEKLKYRHYNVCTGKVIDLCGLAKIVKECANGEVGIKVAAKGLKPEYSGDNSRLMEEMGGFEFTGVEVAVSELYDWYAARKEELDREVLFMDS